MQSVQMFRAINRPNASTAVWKCVKWVKVRVFGVFLVKVCADSEGRGGACVSGIVHGLIHTHCINKND